MGKKKYRNIKVDGQKYGWTIKGSGKERYLGIWKDKIEIYSETLRVSSVTPKMVAEIITENKL